jgi:hypothetical protein
VRLLAYGPAVDAEPIVAVFLDDDGSLVVEIEREHATEILTVAESGVNVAEFAREEAAA